MKPSAAPHRSAAQGSDGSDELPYRIGGDFPEKPRPLLSDSMPLVIILIALLVIAAILCYCIFVVPAREREYPPRNIYGIFSIRFSEEAAAFKPLRR